VTAGRHRVAGRADRSTGFRSVFAEREFRWLWTAGVQSLLGDQLARVALSVLVFERTNSTLLTAAVYALTFLPAFFGGLLLGGLADRYPRRRVLIGCDVVRAVLLAAMALPGTSLLAVSGLLTPPHWWVPRSRPPNQRCWPTSSPTTAMW